MSSITDQQLVVRTQRGDQAALEVLVKRYLGQMYRYAYTYVRTQDDAEDVTQEAFVKAWRNLWRFNAAKPFAPWLYRIVKHTALDFLKKKSAVPFSFFDGPGGTNLPVSVLAESTPSPEALVDSVLLSERLAAALAQLTPGSAEVVSLHHGRGFNFREIAQLVGQPLNTVKSRYRRALLSLRRLL